MNWLRQLTYRPEALRLARTFHLQRMAREMYFHVACPTHGLTTLNVGPYSATFQVRTPEELRIVESLGGGEIEVLKEVLSRLRPMDVVFDVGANVGVYSMFFAKAGEDSCTVYAFEPCERTHKHLVRNVQLNHLEKRVRCIRQALGDCRQFAMLRSGNTIGDGSLVRAGIDEQGEVVEVVTGDDLVRSGMPVPQLVKIDVEGFELSVIHGLESTLRNQRCRTVCCEVHPTMLPSGVSPELVVQVLDSYGFRKRKIVPRWDKTYHVIADKE